MTRVRCLSGHSAGPVTPARPAPVAEAPLITALRAPRCYPHAVTQIEVVETHASWVLLTGEHAYKLKKPVNLGFLDYSTLERRRYACEEELRLNRELAPELYLEVLPITGSAQTPVVNGAGAALEYAVHMRQFDRNRQLDCLLQAGHLNEADMDKAAEYLAAFHGTAPQVDPATDYGSPRKVHAAVCDNFSTLAPLLAGRCRAEIERLRTWSETEYLQQQEFMQARRTQGWVREGHGDLHLANLAYYRSRLLAFDRIEFDPALRWLDVLNDSAFLVMDLLYHARVDLAYRFLNDYLQRTGDYRGIALLRYYLLYRALVRAKVTLLKAGQERDRVKSLALQSDAENYINLGASLLRGPRPVVILMHGLSGSGKTWLSERLMTQLPAIRLRSDVERKRAFGLAPQQASGSAPGKQLYDADANQRTYEELVELARVVVSSGYHALVDAASLYRWQRRLFTNLCEHLGVPCVIVDCRVPLPLLRQRLAARKRSDREVSEADATVLDYQLQFAEPLEEDKRRHTVVAEGGGSPDVVAIIQAIRAQVGRL